MTKIIAVDTETTGLFIHKGCRPFTISAACSEGKKYLWKFRVDPKTRKVIYKDDILDDFFSFLSEHETIVFHNGNFDIQALQTIGLDMDQMFRNHQVEDTMFMSHAYNSRQSHGLKQLGVTLLDFPEDDEKRLARITQASQRAGKKLGWRIASAKDPHPSLRGTRQQIWRSDYWMPEEVAIHENYPKDHEWRHICDEYAVKDAERTLGIYYILRELMDSEQWHTYRNRVADLQCLVRMQQQKVDVKTDQLKSADKEFYNKTNVCIRELRNVLGNDSFNPNSSKQLQVALFDNLGFKPVKEGKSGGPSTDKETISKLLQQCPDVEELPREFKFLIALKKLRKTSTTHKYISNYLDHTVNGLIQTTVKPTATGTNRLAMENPNTGNVGKKDMSDVTEATDHLPPRIMELIGENSEEFKLRNVFGPDEDHQWTCIDYQQFQLRIFAAVSDSQDLIDAFERGDDIHDTVARKIFKTDDISAVQRTAAKNVNFGILFGAGPAKIEETAGIPGLYADFCRNFPQADRYLTSQANMARRVGYVKTVGGYRLYVPPKQIYAASCYVIQGTEAEIVRNAMQRIDKYIQSRKQCPYKLIMMVHDELIFRSEETSLKHLKAIMNIMEDAGNSIGIPSAVDADIVYDTWAKKEALEVDR